MSKFKSDNWKVVKFPDKNNDDKFFEIVTETGDTVCIISTDFNDKVNLIAAAPELAATAQELILEIGDTVLDEMRPVWGNTQVACIENKRNNVILALRRAMDLNSEPTSTTPVASSNPPNAAPVETKFCAWHKQEEQLYWWDALWGNHNAGNGWIGMVPYGQPQSGTDYRSNMILIDHTDCIILPFSTKYKVQDFQNQKSLNL